MGRERALSGRLRHSLRLISKLGSISKDIWTLRQGIGISCINI